MQTAGEPGRAGDGAPAGPRHPKEPEAHQKPVSASPQTVTPRRLFSPLLFHLVLCYCGTGVDPRT